MGRIAAELLPDKKLIGHLQYIIDNFGQIDTINVPELLSYETHSWEACVDVKKYYQNAIPHIRAIDIDPDKPLPMAKCLIENDIDEVLIIKGDTPQNIRKIYPVETADIIRKFKEEIPNIKVYAGLDQYRQGAKQEIEHIKRKIDAGADGFFTQPFYDLNFLEVYADILRDTIVFWGVAPILSNESKGYWENKNNVFFPKEMDINMEWHAAFAKNMINYIQKSNNHIYLMPIIVPPNRYFPAIF